jgi:hypothetical protein
MIDCGKFRDHLRNWGLVYLTILVAVFVVTVGVLGHSLAAGCATVLCGAARSLEWETLTAGLLGLAGGFCVIGITRIQIKEQRAVEVERQLIDVDALIRQCETDAVKIKFVVEKAIAEVVPDCKSSVIRANKCLSRLREVPPPEGIANLVHQQYRLPESIRIRAGIVLMTMKGFQDKNFSVNPPNMQAEDNASKCSHLRFMISQMEMSIEQLKIERNECFRLLMS